METHSFTAAILSLQKTAVGNPFNFVMTLRPVVNTPPVSSQNRKKKKAVTSTGGNKNIREMFSMAK